MTRLLTATIFLITLGLAFAQPPVDYTLMCEVDVEGEVQSSVVGAASHVGGELHVALDQGVTCDGSLTVEQDDTLIVDIVVDGVTGETTVTLATDTEADVPEDEVVDLSGVAQTLPEQAIAGMVGAQENRAAAADRRADAEAKADAARERGEDARDDATEDLPGAPEDAPEAPETAVEHASEAGGGVGIDAKPDEAGERRP